MHTEWSHCVCGTLRHPSSSMLSCLSTLSMDFCWHSIQLYEYTTDTYTYMLFTFVDSVWQTKRIDSKCRLIHSTTVVRVCVRFRICTGNRLFFFLTPHMYRLKWINPQLHEGKEYFDQFNLLIRTNSFGVH